MESFSVSILRILCLFIILCHVPGNCRQQRQWQHISSLRSKTPLSVQKSAAQEVIDRLIPDRGNNFEISVSPGVTEQEEWFRLESSNNKIKITGTTGVTAVWGFHYYIKSFCGCHISWNGDQLKLPENLPVLEQPVVVAAQDLVRYYQNVCTSSYSFVWWNWTRWEREIDWMALQGINMPLAFTGQEEIWRRVYAGLGLTLDDLESFFTGPAFLAWNRMGNIDKWGGPMPLSWFDQQLELQHQIVNRMRSLGMTPVLPAFCGHVPQTLKNYYPNASISRLGNWSNFNSTYSSTYLLDAQDPLYERIGAAFINEMKNEFGIDHIYNCDTFNENVPSSSDPEYIKQIGVSVFNSMLSADADAIWLMQGWMFLDDTFWGLPQAEALLTSVPIGRMVVLDLSAEIVPQYSRLQSFFGQPFIWCVLHNYGGTLGFYGAVDSINQGLYSARLFPNSTLIGIGLTPEGIDQNAVIFEFTLETAYRFVPVQNVSTWFGSYGTRRYSTKNTDAISAWNILSRSVYNCTNQQRFHGQYVIVKRPNLHLKSIIFYPPAELLEAWDLFAQAAADSDLAQSDLFHHDAVDITREALVLLFENTYFDLKNAYSTKNLSALIDRTQTMIEILIDLEDILASHRKFLLGPWIEDARLCGETDEEKTLMQFNALNQITLWGPSGEIVDYATKQWSGIVKDYYHQRWQLFLYDVLDAVQNGTAFNESAFRDKVFSTVEKPFGDRTEVDYPTEPTGNTTALVIALNSKWRQRFPRLRQLERIYRKNQKLRKSFSYPSG